MAAAATLVLKDRNAVNVNYAPVKIKTGEVAEYVDRTQGVIALQPTAKLELSENSTTRRVVLTTVLPVQAVATDPISYETAVTKFTSQKKHALDRRQESEARHRAFIDDATVTAAVENGETAW